MIKKSFQSQFLSILTTSFLLFCSTAHALNKPFIQSHAPLDFAYPNLAISPDNKELYVVGPQSTGDAGGIHIVNLENDVVSAYLPDVTVYNILLSLNGKIGYITSPERFGVFDIERQKVSLSIPETNYPYAMAINQKGTRLYYTYVDEKSISIFNTESNRLIKKITSHDTSPVKCDIRFDGFSDIAIDPSEKKIYLADPGNQSLAVLDLTTEELRLNVIPVSNRCPTGITLDRSHNRLYVSSYVNDAVDVIDLLTDKIIQTIPVGRLSLIRNIVITPDNKKIYLLNFGFDSVTIIDTQDNHVIKTLNNIIAPWTGISSKDGGKIYIAGDNNLMITVVDTMTDEVVKTISIISPFIKK